MLPRILMAIFAALALPVFAQTSSCPVASSTPTIKSDGTICPPSANSNAGGAAPVTNPTPPTVAQPTLPQATVPQPKLPQPVLPTPVVPTPAVPTPVVPQPTLAPSPIPSTGGSGGVSGGAAGAVGR